MTQTLTKPLKPLIKWAGGKSKLTEQILEYVPKGTKRIVEPFLGGGSVLGAHTLPFLGCDLNHELISFYRVVRDSPHDFYQFLKCKQEVYKAIDKEKYYYAARDCYNDRDPESPFYSATSFYALNKLCFNGLYRENQKGEFNVPWGKKDALHVPALEEWLSWSNRLRQGALISYDFGDILSTLRASDFVYLDPPYIPESDTAKFTQYTKKGFGQCHERLLRVLIQLKDNGIPFLMSNSDTELTRSLFIEEGGFNYKTVSLNRGMNRSKKQELFIYA